MSGHRHPAWDQIELAITSHGDPIEGDPATLRPGQHEIELSKAISLKRIADALAPHPPREETER